MRIFRHGSSVVWMALICATALAAWLAGAHRGFHCAAILILLIASTKIYLIMNYFMELGSAPIRWRMAMGAWLFVMTSIVTSAYWVPWL